MSCKFKFPPIMTCTHQSLSQEWRKGLRAVLYLLGLLWLFMAVATVSDIFMGAELGLLGAEGDKQRCTNSGAIEEITSKKKRVLNAATGRHFTVKAPREQFRSAAGEMLVSEVWNDTVANLTLMALGSSAPEILLSVGAQVARLRRVKFSRKFRPFTR